MKFVIYLFSLTECPKYSMCYQDNENETVDEIYTKNWEDCGTKCIENEKCFNFTWLIRNRKCVLFMEDIKSSDFQHCISGKKGCNTSPKIL